MQTNLSADLHLHSVFSSDGTSSILQMTQTAVDKGFSYIAFTDHVDFDYPQNPDRPLYPLLDIVAYRNELDIVKERFRGKIEIAVGIETGIQPDPEVLAKTDRFLLQLQPDFIIASTHCVGKLELSKDGLFRNRTKNQAYQLYLEDLAENIRLSDHFDSVGHLDFVERYYPSRQLQSGETKLLRYADHADWVDTILRMMVEKGKALELNTAGIRYGLGDDVIHPSLEILKRYRELGGELITVGSDAHRDCDIGADFVIAERYLSQAGFRFYCIYRNRKVDFLKLP